MRAKTSVGNKLKRLAREYAKAEANWWLENEVGTDSGKIGRLKRVAFKSRCRLWAAIDELTSVDLTPRSVQGKEG